MLGPMSEPVIHELMQNLSARGIVLATVESCTAGLISHWITNVPGASEHFWGGWSVYDNTAKLALGLPKTLLGNHGAVSAEVAVGLAECGLAKLRSALESGAGEGNVRSPKCFAAISTTGIAGPGGGTPLKPVGLCYAGVAFSDGAAGFIKIQAPAGLSREENKSFFAHEAVRFFLSQSISGD